MTVIEKLEIVGRLCDIIIEDGNATDTRRRELLAIRNGVESVISDLKNKTR